MDPAFDTAMASLRALNAGDEGAYLACFAPDGGQSGPMAGSGLKGRLAVGALFRQLQARFAPLDFRCTRYFSRDREAAMIWSCTASPGGATLRFEGISDLSFEPGGLLHWAQVFWDPGAVLAAQEGHPVRRGEVPELARVWMEALSSRDLPHLRSLFSEEATLRGMLSGGVLRGPAVLAQHMAHARRQLGDPEFHLLAWYATDGRLALRWRAETAGRSFEGVSILDSADGRRIDRVRMFWDPAEAAA